MPSIKTTSANAPSIIPTNCVCRNCLLARPAMIPDPDAQWEMGMRQKPRIDGYRCHASRPTQAGFPPVLGTGFCVFFTDGEGRQPLRHLVSEAVERKEVDA